MIQRSNDKDIIVNDPINILSNSTVSLFNIRKKINSKMTRYVYLLLAANFKQEFSSFIIALQFHDGRLRLMR